MNMKQLKYIAVLAEYNNFTRASEELGISQPSLSQYVKKIEQQLGAELFTRAGQDVRITDAGRAYLEIGIKILNLEDEMKNRIQDISNGHFGSLTIGIAPYRSASLMPRAIKEFHKKFPNIKVILSESITSELKEEAEHGKLDLCISTLPIDERRFNCKPIMNEINVLAVPKNFCKSISKKNYEEVSIKEFKSIPFISLPASQVMGQEFNRLCENCKIILNTTVECQNLMAASSMVAQGIGASLLPFSLVNGNESENVNYYFLKESNSGREIVVFYRKDQYISSPMKEMIEILTKIYSGKGENQ